MKVTLAILVALLSIAPVHAAPIPSVTPAPLNESEYRAQAKELTKSAFLLSSLVVARSSLFRSRFYVWQDLLQHKGASNFDPAGETMRRRHRQILDDLLAIEKINAQLAAMPVPSEFARVGTRLVRFQHALPEAIASIRRGLGTRTPESMEVGEKVLYSASSDMYDAYTALVRSGQPLRDKNASVPV